MRIKILIALLAVLIFCGMAQAKEWYEGGTLQKATVEQFLKGNYDNALATTGDFVAAAISDKEIEKLNMDKLKKGAEDVLACMVTATKGVKAVQKNMAAEIAFMCMTQLKKDYPWMLTK